MAGPEGTTLSAKIGELELTLNTGRYAKQSSGSVFVRYGDTTVLVNANATKEPKDVPFLPLTVNYEEKLSGGGRIPGSFFRREGRPTERETLLARIVDRSIRPLFADGWNYETQVIASVFSFDGENDPDHLALTAASAALCMSDIPFAGPIAGCRVGRVDGALVVNPTNAQRAKADLDIFVAASKDAIVMVEGGAEEVDEATMVEALETGRAAVQPLIALQEQLMAEVGKAKRQANPLLVPPEVVKEVAEIADPKLHDAFAVNEKHARYAALDVVKDEVLAHFAEKLGEEAWGTARPVYKAAFNETKHHHMRHQNPRHQEADRRPQPHRHPPDLGRGRDPAPGPRVGVLHPRRDPVDHQRHAGHQPGRAAHRGALGHVLQEVHAPLQLPALLGGRGEAHGLHQPPGDWPRDARRARPDHPAAHRGRRLPLHHPRGQRHHRVQRLLVHGHRVRRDAGADGLRRAHQGPGGRHRHGPHHGGRRLRGPLGHPRRRGPPRRHGLQGLRHREGHHRHPDGHQVPGAHPGDHVPGPRPGP